MKRIAYSLTLLSCTLFTYLIIFPNDFFLPFTSFKKDKSQFVYSRKLSRVVLYDKNQVNETLLAIIKHPDQYIASQRAFIKNNNKRTVVKIEGEKPAILKRYNISSIYDWITKCPFRSSKAFRSWYYQTALIENGIHTARPIALIEKRWGPFWRETYLISDYIQGPTLAEKIPQLSLKENQKISKQILGVINRFYDLKWLHRDFVARNIIMKGDDLSIIDVDEMHSYTFQNEIFKNKFYKKHILKLLNKSSLSPSFIQTFLSSYNDINQDFSNQTSKLPCDSIK